MKIDKSKPIMSSMLALAIVEGISPENITEDDMIEAYQTLIDSGEAWTLPGRIGRAAMDLIDNGQCTL